MKIGTYSNINLPIPRTRCYEPCNDSHKQAGARANKAACSRRFGPCDAQSDGDDSGAEDDAHECL